MGEKRLEAGAIIYREGDVAELAYEVISGRVEIIETKHGTESLIRIIEAGKTFGEFAIFDPQTLRPYTARTIEATVLNAISEEEFKKLVSECPKPIQPFLAISFEKMKATKVKEKASISTLLENNISKISIAPGSEIMKAQFKAVDVPLERLPFRIGGFPEGGEVTRRAQLHLAITSTSNPLKVSRQHCELAVENNVLYVFDLGSRFCTRVNDSNIGRGYGTYKAPLKAGVNEIILGSSDKTSPYKLTITCS